jgi:hypothetical protein
MAEVNELRRIQNWLQDETFTPGYEIREHLWNRYDFLIWRFGFGFGFCAGGLFWGILVVIYKNWGG